MPDLEGVGENYSGEEAKQIKPIIDDAFEGEEGILEIFKGVYSHAKKGSVPHAQFIMKYYFDEQSELEGMPRDFELIRKIIDQNDGS